MSVRPVPVTAFEPGKGLLPELQRLIQRSVIPYQYEILNDGIPGVEKSHALENLRLAARKMQGGEIAKDAFYGMVFQDSDLAKWLEAACYSLAFCPDAELEGKIDSVIDLLEQAQGEDGYLNSYFTVKEPERRWTNLQEAHELYCAGHLIEAACAHYEVTGSARLLQIMERNADCIYRHFMEECPHGYSGHPEIELALLRLYQATGKEKYLELSRHFLEVRGEAPNYFIEEKKVRGWNVWGTDGNDAQDTDYTQSTKPVREQTEAVGHAVRAVYLYTAMADLAAQTGDERLKTACEALWNSITRRKMYVTGGIGSTVLGEAFTVDYDLPNDTVYAETCASIGLIFFARQMLRLTEKGEYADVMERALYNTVLGGMQLDGKRFFYVNPLEVTPGISGKAVTQRHVLPQRPQWYACACCPPNVARLLSSLGSYAYTQGDNTLYAHLYLGGTVKTGWGYSLTCETEYPFRGEVKYTFHGEASAALAFRIPGWSEKTALTLNGKAIDLSDAGKTGYAKLSGAFHEGDEIVLTLDLTPRKVYSSPKVPADTGKVAFQRGPLIYCAEGVDNGGEVLALSVDKSGEPVDAGQAKDLGLPMLEVPGWRAKDQEELYSFRRPERKVVKLRLIPYYAWGNRGLNQMRVWLPEE